ncbi:uncharacterized protein LOC112904154 [Agrilus planipennis]|uniref:Uncharacterized protein LOC108733368 n=1 Tax=Agrilus planipennis TaxID=224129 RepID=A0A1W4WJ03_AGRPL|nr:uncharacterized protein LOC108733368 [Agrilus planipennis]XP_025829296.1 uncharacterized protein LOC112904154 [Agrilus planipennis]
MFMLLVIGLLVATVGTEAFTNPIAPNAPDPWMVSYEGFYYLIATSWDNYFSIRKATTLEGLKNASNTVVYTFDGHTGWAPELHQVDGKWYLYYTSCAPGTENYACHRNHVAESVGDDPMGPYSHKADLIDDGDPMELDPSLIKINGKFYLIASFIADTQQLYIRELTNPYTLAPGVKHMISAPTYDWEIEGGTTNEGPEPLYHDNRTFIVYSASSCATPDYKLGLLEFVGTDPLNITHWKKYPNPVFQKDEGHHVYGPGHNGFFKSADGTEDWIVYHANSSPDGVCYMDRSSRAQKFTWGADGLPIFGVPEAEGVELEEPSSEQ